MFRQMRGCNTGLTYVFYRVNDLLKNTVGIILLQLQRYNPTVIVATGTLSDAYSFIP